jgi:hypothetical protein
MWQKSGIIASVILPSPLDSHHIRRNWAWPDCHGLSRVNNESAAGFALAAVGAANTPRPFDWDRL